MSFFILILLRSQYFIVYSGYGNLSNFELTRAVPNTFSIKDLVFSTSVLISYSSPILKTFLHPSYLFKYLINTCANSFSL